MMVSAGRMLVLSNVPVQPDFAFCMMSHMHGNVAIFLVH